MEGIDPQLIRTVADNLAIQSVKALYCEGADCLPSDPARAEALLTQVFTEDVAADYASGEVLQGRAAVLDFLLNRIGKSRDWVWHSIHTPRIELDGDKATAYWTIIALMKAKGSTKTEQATGRYVDVLRRTSDGWKISHMRFIREGD
jgi:ketosteroid isomerase-like protein